MKKNNIHKQTLKQSSGEGSSGIVNQSFLQGGGGGGGMVDLPYWNGRVRAIFTHRCQNRVKCVRLMQNRQKTGIGKGGWWNRRLEFLLLARGGVMVGLHCWNGRPTVLEWSTWSSERDNGTQALKQNSVVSVHLTQNRGRRRARS